MSNFHHLWSGNPAMNQSHLIIRCHDVSCCTLHLVCPNTVKYCPPQTHTHQKKTPNALVCTSCCRCAEHKSAPHSLNKWSTPGETNFKKAKGPVPFLKGLFSPLFPALCWAIWGYWFASAVVWWDEMAARTANLVFYAGDVQTLRLRPKTGGGFFVQPWCLLEVFLWEIVMNIFFNTETNLKCVLNYNRYAWIDKWIASFPTKIAIKYIVVRKWLMLLYAPLEKLMLSTTKRTKTLIFLFLAPRNLLILAQ